MRLGVLEVTARPGSIRVRMRDEMPAGIHRDETRVLQEPWIDLATVPGYLVAQWIAFSLEPLSAGRGERVDCVGLRALDRAAHHRHPARRVFARAASRNRGEHRYRRLTHGDHVQVSRRCGGRTPRWSRHNRPDGTRRRDGTMRASIQSVMYTLWSCNSVRTVSRSSVE